MQESDTWLAIIDDGQDKHARNVILRLGARRFGLPSTAVISRVQAVTDLDRLVRMEDAILDATDWNAILAAP